MNEENNQVLQETANKYENAIHDFFIQMQLNKPQQAMFYLGRMLNSVEFIQKGKKKTVIEKVNFNGMDRDAIQRLRISLIEKAKQYSRIGSVIFLDRSFGELFAYNNWKMNPQEAVFFLLTGYSFGISKKEADNLENTETQNA
jgi:CRISPR-associated protein Csh1